MSTSRSIHVITHSHLAWDNSIPPVARVHSGDIVDFDCVDASNGQITPESTIQAISEFDNSRLDQVNGPVYVEGAEAGDVLEVEVLNVQTADWGWTAIIPNFGLLAEEFTEPHLKIWKIEQGNEATGEEGYAMFKPGIRIPIAPFCGEMGLAPAEPGAKSTIPPYYHGRFGFETDFFLSYTHFPDLLCNKRW
jgi:acetamidase/formamidase